jgi:hypothetical protein
MPITTEDVVTSVGRIKVIQGGRRRFIEFTMGRVVDVGVIGVTVNPVGMKALVICRPDDLEVVGEQHKPPPERNDTAIEPGEFATGGVVPPPAEVQVPAGTTISAPEGSIAVSGGVEQEPPKPRRKARTIKDKREAEGEGDKPAAKPASTRRRRR